MRAKKELTCDRCGLRYSASMFKKINFKTLCKYCLDPEDFIKG